jgi:hydrogenase expression/formation protein HypE
VNDLAVWRGRCLCLSLNAFIEEGLEFARLDRLVASMALAARSARCALQPATKVVRRGEGGGVYFATTGVGIRRPGLRLGLDRVSEGDVILASGPVGDHATAVLLAREQFGLRGDLASDAASVLPLTAALLSMPGLRFMRDPTRGGLATVAHEIARATGLCVRLHGPAIPIRPPVLSVCEMLGFDPLYSPAKGAWSRCWLPRTRARWRVARDACGRDAARIGVVQGPATGDSRNGTGRRTLPRGTGR